MKLFSLIASCLFLQFTSQKATGQPNAGDFSLGLDIAGNRNKAYRLDTNYLSEHTIYTLNFKPQIGIFITPKIEVGGFTHLWFSHTINSQSIEDTLSTNSKEISKRTFLSLTAGGYLSYYYPIDDKLYWVNMLTYERGYNSIGVNFASFISKNSNSVKRFYFSNIRWQTGLNYFFKPNLNLSINMAVLSIFKSSGGAIRIDVLSRKSFFSNSLLSVGIKYLIQAKDE